MQKLSQSQAEKDAKESSQFIPSNKFLQAFFFLLVIFLPTQLGKHFWPQFSIILGIRVDYLSPTIYFSDIIIFVFLFLRLRQIGFSKICKSIQTHSLRFSLYSLPFLFISIGIFFSENPLAGWYGFLKLTEFVMLGFMLKDLIGKQPYKKLLASGLGIGIVFESILAILQFARQGSLGGFWYFLGERTFNGSTPGIANASLNGELVLRPYGTFSHPNVLAGYLLIAATIVISNFQFPISNYKKIVYAFLLFLGTAALLLTLSRIAILVWGGILGINLTRILYNKFGKPRKHSIFFYLFTIFCLLFLIYLIPPLRYRFTFSLFTDEAVVDRITLIDTSLEMIKTYPIFGIGFYNFFTALPHFSSTAVQTGNVQPVHNIFLLTAAETGIAGAIFVIWFFWITAYKLKFQISNFKFQILMAIIILGIFDHYFLTLQQGQLLLTIAFALCWSDGTRQIKIRRS